MDTIISLSDALITIHDPRIDRTKKHKLVDILIIALCATICGVEALAAFCACLPYRPLQNILL